MAEDEAAHANLIAAIDRVDDMSWPKTRHTILYGALIHIAGLLGLQIVKIEPPVAKDDNPPA